MEVTEMQGYFDILQIGTAVFQAGICLIQAVVIVWILTKLYGRRHDGIRGMAGSAVATALLFFFFWRRAKRLCFNKRSFVAVGPYFYYNDICHFGASANLETETDGSVCGYCANSIYICYDLQFCPCSADYDISGDT